MSTKRTVVTAQTCFLQETHYIHTKMDTAKRRLRDPHRLSWFKSVRREPGQDPEFEVNVWRCPCCGSAHLDYRKNRLVGVVSEEEFVDFFDDQTSLFEQEKEEQEKEHRKEIHFQDVSKDDGEHRCKKCGKSSTLDSEPLIVVLQRTKTRSRSELKVILLHVPFKDLLTMVGLTGFRIQDVDPRASFTESIVFNFNRGTSFITLEEEDYLERIVAVRDLTNSIWSDGPLFQAIFLHPQVNRHFYEQFNDAYPGENPFSREEMTPMHYVHLCRFQDFSRFFYDSIPFSLKQSITLEKPFRKAAKNLRTRDEAIARVRRALPYDTKEIRRILYMEKPGLLFFLRELKIICEVLRVTSEKLCHTKRFAKREEAQLEDLEDRISRDLFVKFLRLPSAVSIASEIQAYPGTTEFLCILFEEIGSRKILSLLEHASPQLFEIGERYAYASPFKKREILNMGIALCKNKYTWDPLSGSCSEPVPSTVNGDLKEMWVGNYRFKPVTYKQEYRQAADQLHNCLMSWCSQTEPNPVVIVYHKYKIVAAIEVLLDVRTVAQAYLAYNQDLDNDPALHHAYRKWLVRSGLKELGCDF